MCSEGHDHSHNHEESFEVSRRDLLAAFGLAAGAAALSPLGAAPAGAADTGNKPVNVYKPYRYSLAGDHHIHTTYSRDAMYSVSTQVKNAESNGLQWMVITDHGATAHQKLSIDLITPDINAARRKSQMHIFQGLEWNIPGGEHATLIVPPTQTTVQLLKDFELQFDGQVLADAKVVASPTVAAAEKYAVDGIKWLGKQIESGAIPSALVFANHPARRGLDSPHEVRAWRDAYPGIAVGWEGAPGHQVAAHPDVQKAIVASGSTTINGRGYYDYSPLADSFPGYAPTATENPYRTYGGFDWFTSRVGGLWDSLLAEGKPWWITANSDSHQNYLDTLIGAQLTKSGSLDSAFYNANGSYGAPIDSGVKQATYGDFAPGAYSSTIVTSAFNSYNGIMAALKSGNIIVTHGGLISGADIQVYSDSDKRGVTTGGRTYAKKGDNVTAVITVSLAMIANGSGSIPKLKNVQLISGPVTGPVTDQDTMFAPQTSIIKNFEITGTNLTFTYTFKNVQRPFYLRYRGNNGINLDKDGLNPKMDVLGNSNPWDDLWFYTNPIFINVD
jgi:hypothetical protein